MSIQYAGGTIVNATFTGTTKQDIVSNLQTHLTAAGWTVVSGGGTTDVLMQSASTPTAANFIRVRLRSTNLSNCACVNMQNTAEDRVSQNYFLLPGAAKTYRFIANKYQWFCFTPGTSAGREYVAMGTLYTPSFLHGVITGEQGWIQGNGGIHDANATVYKTWRTAIACTEGWSTGLVNGSMYNHDTGGGPYVMDQRLVIPMQPFNQHYTVGYRWHDDSLLIGDPLLAFGIASSTDEAKIRGQLWGAMFLSAPFAADTVLTSVDGHDWMAITNNNGGDTTHARGTLFVAIT